MCAKPKIDYTARDYEAIRIALKAHLQAKFPDTWRDMYESGMGMAILDLLAYSFDILSFHLDYRANEQFLPTARDRDSVLNIGKMVGYTLRPPTSASVECTATIAAIQVVDVIVPAGVEVVTASGVVFRTLSEQRIPAGKDRVPDPADGTPGIIFAEGETHTDTFSSVGTGFQKFKLTVPGVISGSIDVKVSGDTWIQVDSLVFGTETSQVFAVHYDEDDYGYIEFGDGENGMIPPAVVNSIVVSYRIGGGLRGNIALSEINEAVTGHLNDGLMTPISIDVVNDEHRGSGGEERETVEHAKYWIPRWVSANGRAVTESDFDVLATAFSDPTYGAPAFAKARLKQEIPELNTVELHVWARDSEGNITEPSSGLKSALETYFMNNEDGAVRVICTDVEVLDGEIVYIDVDLSTTISSEFSSATIIDSITRALDALFSSSDNRPGAAFRLSHVYDAVQDIAGVQHTLVNGLTASKKSSSTVATGDGSTVHFEFTLELDPSLPAIPHTVRVWAGTQEAVDDGEGHLMIGVAEVGTVDYDSGAVVIDFPVAPLNGQSVNCEYRHNLDYSRSEVAGLSDGTATFEGIVTYPPVVPYDPTTGQKGIAFTDGFETILDSYVDPILGAIGGDGRLFNVSGVQVGTINYTSGSYLFNFSAPPAVGTQIRTAYSQMLKTPSEDIPVSKAQLAVKGLYTVSTEVVAE